MGCPTREAEFVRTDDYFSPSEAAARPSVFLDRRPSEPYKSVGVIYVRVPNSTSLTDIAGLAAEKGREVGCDLLIDRAIHSVSSAIPADLPRWSVIIEEPLRNKGRRPNAGRAAYPGDPRAAALAAQAQPIVIQQPPLVQPGTTFYPPPEPTISREFVCGVYLRSNVRRSALASGGSPFGAGATSAFARSSELRVPNDTERRATSEPPKGGGGFSFGTSPAANEQACTGAKLPFRPLGEGFAACDGVVADVGFPAKSLLRFCEGSLCSVEIVGKPDGVKKAQWKPRFEALKDALSGKYGPPTYRAGREPPDCAVDTDACRITGLHAHSVGWAWKSGEQIELTIEVNATIMEETRAYSALLILDYLQRPLAPSAASAPPETPKTPKTPTGQPPAGL